MSSYQTLDTGITRADLDTYLVESGYWGNAERRRRHAYVLSPSAYLLSLKQKGDIHRLARSTYAAVRKLNDRLVTLARPGTHLSHEDAAFVKLGTMASRALLRPVDGESRIPPVIKVDIIQNSEGRYFIAEVDVYNPRGFGYAALLEESLPPTLMTSRFPGIAGLLEIFEASQHKDVEWHVLVSEFERYYGTAFEVLARSFGKRGTTLRIVSEEDVARGRVRFSGTSTAMLAIPESLHAYPKTRDYLLDLYRAKTLHTLYPPLAYLGSKAFLPYLRGCVGMEEFIPPTVLVGEKHKNALPNPDSPAVLKAAVSSGMKGVFFSDLDSVEFLSTLERVRKSKNTSWILQEQVPQESVPVTVFTSEGKRTVGDYFLRITAYVSEHGVVDAEVTGRPDRKVHGAPDCIQLPVILP